jgi:hypothetical protein
MYIVTTCYWVILGLKMCNLGFFVEGNKIKTFYYKFQSMFPNVTPLKDDSLKDKLKERKW